MVTDYKPLNKKVTVLFIPRVGVRVFKVSLMASLQTYFKACGGNFSANCVSLLRPKAGKSANILLVLWKNKDLSPQPLKANMSPLMRPWKSPISLSKAQK